MYVFSCETCCRSTAFAMVAILTLSGCTEAVRLGGGAPAEHALALIPREDKSPAVPSFAPMDHQDKVLYYESDSLIEASDQTVRSNLIAAAQARCTPNQQPDMKVKIVGPIAAILIAALGSVLTEAVLGEIDEATQRELEMYMASYGASATVQLYTALNKINGVQVPVLGHKCIRYTRLQSRKDKKVIQLDFLAEMDTTAAHEAIQIRPLLLYHDGKSGAVQKGLVASAAFAVKAEGASLSAGDSQTAVYFERTVYVSELSVDSKAKTVPRWEFLFKKGERALTYVPYFELYQLPLLRMAAYNEGTSSVEVAFGSTTLSVEVAEVATPPELLTKLAKIYKSKRGDISSAASDAIKARLDKSKGQ